MSITTTARNADRIPDGLGVHRVRTFWRASRIAADRAYGFSGLQAQRTRSGPGRLAVDVAGEADGHRPGSGIIISGGASLSLTGEPGVSARWSVFVVGLLAYVLETALIITPPVFGLTLAGSPRGYPELPIAVGWSLASGWPLLLEMIAMTAALALNPERLGTTRRRKALVKAGRYALTLDFLVRSPIAGRCRRRRSAG